MRGSESGWCAFPGSRAEKEVLEDTAPLALGRSLRDGFEPPGLVNDTPSYPPFQQPFLLSPLYTEWDNSHAVLGRSQNEYYLSTPCVRLAPGISNA